ncbi:MAG TPA: class I SAM-dependent methyltransferase [Pyrinomonadaceae bacterium]|nr:class I SAM-dependent methyltransferase [Pyrinomonadaceae bacterium]
MFQPALDQNSAPLSSRLTSISRRRALGDRFENQSEGALRGLRRRLSREVRRRQVGRAYDMALEIARYVQRADEILDVGCGNGFIAHHLSALLGSYVLGLDVAGPPQAPINFREYDGRNFPLAGESFEAVLFCYVLHHAEDAPAILAELRRVLRPDGIAVIYEDLPESFFDRIVCAIHNRKWRKRTGPCTFYLREDWKKIFMAAGFEIVDTRRLSRWRKIVHPVRRQLFVLRPVIERSRNYSSTRSAEIWPALSPVPMAERISV